MGIYMPRVSRALLGCELRMILNCSLKTKFASPMSHYCMSSYSSSIGKETLRQ